jgi:hypothetical protein
MCRSTFWGDGGLSSYKVRYLLLCTSLVTTGTRTLCNDFVTTSQILLASPNKVRYYIRHSTISASALLPQPPPPPPPLLSCCIRRPPWHPQVALDLPHHPPHSVPLPLVCTRIVSSTATVNCGLLIVHCRAANSFGQSHAAFARWGHSSR